MMQIEEGKFYRTRDGRKVGPMEVSSQEPDRPFKGRIAPENLEALFFRSGAHCEDAGCKFDIIAEWSDPSVGPVRTVTRKEIVPGVYGRIGVSGTFQNNALLHWTDRQGGRVDGGNFSAPELRAAAATLIEIADALDADSPNPR